MADTTPAADQSPSRAPVAKVTAATAGAAVGTVICLLLGIWVDVPVGLEGGLATVGAFAAGYLTPPRGG